jgi:hypothetical protein
LLLSRRPLSIAIMHAAERLIIFNWASVASVCSGRTLVLCE